MNIKEQKAEPTSNSGNSTKPNVKCGGGKLSKVQNELIKQMQDGTICHYIQGLESRCFLATTHKNISWATIFRLEDLELVERAEKYVILTEKGRSHCI